MYLSIITGYSYPGTGPVEVSADKLWFSVFACLSLEFWGHSLPCGLNLFDRSRECYWFFSLFSFYLLGWSKDFEVPCMLIWKLEVLCWDVLNWWMDWSWKEMKKLLKLKLDICIDNMCYTSARQKVHEVLPGIKTEVFLDDWNSGEVM